MATATGRRRSPAPVIDLVSDDEDELVPPPRAAAEPDSNPEPVEQNGTYEFFGDEAVWIPDESPTAATQPSPRITPASPEQPGTVQLVKGEPVFTSDMCLQQVLDVFPDVSHEHVLKLYDELGQSVPPLPGADRYENIINKLVEANSYPKQGKGKQSELKRKPEDDLKHDDFKRWEGADRPPSTALLGISMAAALKAEFPFMSFRDIKQEIAKHRHLFPTYISLAALSDSRDTGSTGRPGSPIESASTYLLNSGFPALYDELQAARRRVSIIRSERTITLAKRRAEDENLKRAMEAGEIAECQACFDDLPMNRQVHCNGDTAHFTCFECITNYIKSEVGQSRCGVVCTSGCGAAYARAQLHLLDDKRLFEKLEQLQQEKDIRDANLEDLEECPFCDYKAILPPIEEDFEFRCRNSDCEQVSCRRCKAASHIPRSCEEHAKDNKLDSRHKIEEAMTAALVRKCGRCSKPFIKDLGCNKMSCPSCGNLQCYVCSASLTDYNHFDQTANGRPNPNSADPSVKRCPLYDNVEERHAREIKEAEAKARTEAMEANPDISEEDLTMKESDAVRKAAQANMYRPGGARVAHDPHPGRFDPFDFEAGLYDDVVFHENGGDGDAPLRHLAARERIAQQQREPLIRRRMNAMRARVQQQAGLRLAAAARAEMNRARLVEVIRARAAAQVAARAPHREARIADNPWRGPLGYGFDGHVAGHGVQAHLAQPQPMYRGLAHPHPDQALQMGPHGMIGYMPVYGMQMPGAGRFPPQQAPTPAPQSNAASQTNTNGSGNTVDVVGGAPAAPQPGGNLGDSPARGLGAQNNGLRGQQGLFDASTGDPFGGVDADPFGFGRIVAGEPAPRVPGMLAPGQNPNHALGRNAHPEVRGQHDALAYGAAPRGLSHEVRNMQNQAGGNGDAQNLRNRAGGNEEV